MLELSVLIVIAMQIKECWRSRVLGQEGLRVSAVDLLLTWRPAEADFSWEEFHLTTIFTSMNLDTRLSLTRYIRMRSNIASSGQKDNVTRFLRQGCWIRSPKQAFTANPALILSNYLSSHPQLPFLCQYLHRKATHIP